MLALPLDGHVLRRVDAVFRKDVVERVFRRRALAAGVNRPAAQVFNRLHAVAALDDINHAERIDRQHLNLALRILVKHGSQIRRNSRDIRFALDDFGRHFINRRSNGKGICVALDRAAFRFVHQLNHAHRGRPLEGSHVHLRFSQRGRAEGQHRRTAHGGKSFEFQHHKHPSFFINTEFVYPTHVHIRRA